MNYIGTENLQQFALPLQDCRATALNGWVSELIRLRSPLLKEMVMS